VQGASKVLDRAETCGTSAEILSVRQDEPGDNRDAAIEFAHQFVACPP
jgi:hypothetical protein